MKQIKTGEQVVPKKICLNIQKGHKRRIFEKNINPTMCLSKQNFCFMHILEDIENNEAPIIFFKTKIYKYLLFRYFIQFINIL